VLSFVNCVSPPRKEDFKVLSIAPPPNQADQLLKHSSKIQMYGYQDITLMLTTYRTGKSLDDSTMTSEDALLVDIIYILSFDDLNDLPHLISKIDTR
jgi:hypothetical protein